MDIFEEPEAFGPYRLFAKVAQGGMAEVFLATSTKKDFQGQFLAIKRLLPHLNSNKPFVNLLIHEAKIGVLLNHPSIAQVFDLGSYKAEFFIAMEFVHGKSLDKIINKIREGKAERLDPEIATFIVLEVLRALAFAHELKDVKGRELNIIHRDVTPGNILLEYKGNIKLTDFGIATAESRLQPEFTQSAMGKLVYMPPEQAVNDPVVKASDLYSLGVVYYEMLTGQLPFQSDSPTGLYRKIVDGKMADIRVTGAGISEGLAKILMKLIDKSVRRRFRNAPELFEALHQHFLKEAELDFQSRAVRNYYRKKLAEYLRTSFEEEIVEELEVIQRALKGPEEIEDLKATAPQQVPPSLRSQDPVLEISDIPEATVFEPDHTDEATRHYPLTETERKAIIEGLPPREAVQKVEGGKERTSNFELVTIPSYDLNLDSEAFTGISVVQRLNQAALDPDQKETLKQQIPAIEITSQAELEAFEASTFSGGKEVIELDSTRGMSRQKILKDFEKIKKDSGQTPVSAASLAMAKTPNVRSNPNYKTEPYERPRNSRFFPFLLSLLGIVILGTAILVLLPTLKSLFPSPLLLLPTQQISVVFFGEADLSQQKQFFNVLSNPDSPNGLKKVEELFNREYTRYTGDTQPVLRLISHEPSLIPRSLSTHQDVTQLLRSPKIFEFFEQQGFQRKQASDLTMMVYFFPFDPSSKRNPAFPEEYLGDHPKSLGVVFAPAHATRLASILVNLSREIAKIYGAKDKQDLSGLALTPEGIADPNRSPLFPQEKAELLAKDVPLGLLSERPVESMEEVVIGPYTAFELGWISIEKRRLITATDAR